MLISTVQVSRNQNLVNEFQQAFEKLDEGQINQLLEQGANPNQFIVPNQKFLNTFCKRFVRLNFNQNDFLNQVGEFIAHAQQSPKEFFSSKTQKIIKNAIEIKESVDSGMKISEVIIQDYLDLVADQISANYGKVELESLSKNGLTPLQIATELKLDSLKQKLLDSGAQNIDYSLPNA